MNNSLVRTTTYIESNILNLAKKKAIDENKSFYQLVNEALKIRLSVPINSKKPKRKPLVYEKVFPTYNMGSAKRKIRRIDAYE